MQIEKYYSCVENNITTTSIYQLNLAIPQFFNCTRGAIDFEKEIVWFYKLGELPITEVKDFLNYHFLLCNDKDKFITYTKHMVDKGLEYNNKEHQWVKERIEGIEITGKPYKYEIIDKFKATACLEWIEMKRKLIETISTPQQPSKGKAPQQNEIEPKNSFKYITPSQQEHIESVFNKLKQNDKNIVFISDEVKLTDFKKIFNNTPLNKINPINWQKSKASLRYFIKQFPFDMSDKNLFKITYCCFNYIDKKDYTQIQNAKQKREKDKTAIDNIFKLYPFLK